MTEFAAGFVKLSFERLQLKGKRPEFSLIFALIWNSIEENMKLAQRLKAISIVLGAFLALSACQNQGGDQNAASA